MAKIEESIGIIKFLCEKFNLTLGELRHKIEFISDSDADEDPDWTISQAVRGLNDKGIMTSDLLNTWELVTLMVKGDYLHEDYREEFRDKVLQALDGGFENPDGGKTLVVMDQETVLKAGFDLSQLSNSWMSADLMGGELGKKSGDDLLWSLVEDYQEGAKSSDESEDFKDDDNADDSTDVKVDSLVIYYRVGLKGYTLDVAVKEVQNLVNRLTPMLWAGQVKLVLTGNASAMSPMKEAHRVSLMPVNEALKTNVNEKMPLALVESLVGITPSSDGKSAPEQYGFYSVQNQWWRQILPGSSIKGLGFNYMQKLGEVTLWDPKTHEKIDGLPGNLMGWVRERGGEAHVVGADHSSVPDSQGFDTSHFCPITPDNLGQIGTYVGCNDALGGSWNLSYIWNIFEYRPTYRTLEALCLSILAEKACRAGVGEMFEVISKQWSESLQKVSPAEGDNLMVSLRDTYVPGEGFDEAGLARVEAARGPVLNQIAQIAPSVVQ